MTKRHDIYIQQGATFAWTYTKLDSAGAAVDLTGYTARMSIKLGYVRATEAYLSTGADADGGTITLGGAAGTVALAMTAAQTRALADDLAFYALASVENGPQPEPTMEVCFIYDLELVAADGTVTRELEGRLTVSREVTGI